MNTIEVHDDTKHHSHADVGFMQMYSIPEYLAITLFPASDLPISTFIKFVIPSITSTHQAALPSIHQYLCLEPPHSSPIDHALLSSLPIPIEPIITALIHVAPEAWGAGNCSIVYAHTNLMYRYPFWLIAFWDCVTKDIIPPLMKWQAACHFVEQHLHGPEPSLSVASDFQAHLSMLPWEGNVSSFMDHSPISKLAQFASQSWLCNNNINFVLIVVIEHHVTESSGGSHCTHPFYLSGNLSPAKINIRVAYSPSMQLSITFFQKLILSSHLIAMHSNGAWMQFGVAIIDTHLHTLSQIKSGEVFLPQPPSHATDSESNNIFSSPGL
ncbi:hypothetical protein EDB19DRAFT_1912519 [Suillus lakei]|nr:hypothetical protein EDB19DRAFT_1912519 [Suillus lakei]